MYDPTFIQCFLPLIVSCVLLAGFLDCFSEIKLLIYTIAVLSKSNDLVQLAMAKSSFVSNTLSNNVGMLSFVMQFGGIVQIFCDHG